MVRENMVDINPFRDPGAFVDERSVCRCRLFGIDQTCHLLIFLEGVIQVVVEIAGGKDADIFILGGQFSDPIYRGRNFIFHGLFLSFRSEMRVHQSIGFSVGLIAENAPCQHSAFIRGMVAVSVFGSAVIQQIKPGRIIFEMTGVSEEVAREALTLSIHKLPFKTKIVTRESENELY